MHKYIFSRKYNMKNPNPNPIQLWWPLTDTHWILPKIRHVGPFWSLHHARTHATLVPFPWLARDAGKPPRDMSAFINSQSRCSLTQPCSFWGKMYRRGQQSFSKIAFSSFLAAVPRGYFHFTRQYNKSWSCIGWLLIKSSTYLHENAKEQEEEWQGWVDERQHCFGLAHLSSPIWR